MPTKMFLWAFSVVLHIAAILSLRENMSDRILLNSVPPYLVILNNLKKNTCFTIIVFPGLLIMIFEFSIQFAIIWYSIYHDLSNI